jgi:hypothetical protein
MKVKTIHFASRASVKIRDSYYTFEYSEDREIEDGDDLEQEKQNLIADCNKVVDDQIQEVVDLLKVSK